MIDFFFLVSPREYSAHVRVRMREVHAAVEKRTRGFNGRESINAEKGGSRGGKGGEERTRLSPPRPPASSQPMSRDVLSRHSIDVRSSDRPLLPETGSLSRDLHRRSFISSCPS